MSVVFCQLCTICYQGKDIGRKSKLPQHTRNTTNSLQVILANGQLGKTRLQMVSYHTKLRWLPPLRSTNS